MNLSHNIIDSRYNLLNARFRTIRCIVSWDAAGRVARLCGMHPHLNGLRVSFYSLFSIETLRINSRIPL